MYISNPGPWWLIWPSCIAAQRDDDYCTLQKKMKCVAHFYSKYFYITPRMLITLTSKWARLRLKSPASRLFAQPFAQAPIKENTEAGRHWPLWGESTGDRGFPSQRASNAENVSISWRHHGHTGSSVFAVRHTYMCLVSLHYVKYTLYHKL